jgi:DNA-directed RNA polymerase subunit H (RpoH/RPB5)
LVPKHTLFPKDEVPNLKKQLNIQSISNLPFIRFHQDIQARLLGAIPGDIIQIVRPSSSAGTETVYRVCVP